MKLSVSGVIANVSAEPRAMKDIKTFCEIVLRRTWKEERVFCLWNSCTISNSVWRVLRCMKRGLIFSRMYRTKAVHLPVLNREILFNFQFGVPIKCMFAINILKVPLCYQRPELFIASPISQTFRHIRIRTRLLIKRNYVFNYLHANRGHYDIKFGDYEGTRYSNLFVYWDGF